MWEHSVVRKFPVINQFICCKRDREKNWRNWQKKKKDFDINWMATICKWDLCPQKIVDLLLWIGFIPLVPDSLNSFVGNDHRSFNLPELIWLRWGSAMKTCSWRLWFVRREAMDPVVVDIGPVPHPLSGPVRSVAKFTMHSGWDLIFLFQSNADSEITKKSKKWC